MSVPAFRRVLAQSSCSASLRQSAAASSSKACSRRLMSSGTHGAKEQAKSDLPWMIGSGAAVVLGASYILTPRSKQAAHKKAAAAHKHIEEAVAEPEPEVMKDSEGTEAEVSGSQEQSIEADSPAEAKLAEEESVEAPFDAGSPGKSEESHGDNEQKEKPSQGKDLEALKTPVDLGDARSTAKEGQAPLEAKHK